MNNCLTLQDPKRVSKIISSSSATANDREWMRLALDEAYKGLGSTSPNPPVGAVIVKNGQFVSKGFHRKAGEAHAEIRAMESVPEDQLRGATLYVTLEPCSTQGRTPPCVQAIRKAGFRRVVVGSVDPNPRHAGDGLIQLQDAGIQIVAGVMEAECNELIRFFSKHILSGRPYVIAKTGMTLDGRITPPPGRSQWITSERARADVQRLRSMVDAILIGGETLRKDNPQLTLRDEFAPQDRPQPWRVIVSRSGEVPHNAKVFTDQYRDRTKLFHVEHLDPVFTKLGKIGVSSVLLECGGRLMAHAFENQMVDEVVFYVAPMIGGGERRAVEGQDFRCHLVDPVTEMVGPDLRVSAKVRYEDSGESTAS